MSEASTLQLIFAGEILEGFSTTEVKLRLAQALKLDEARLRSLFSGKRVVIKRGVDAAAADRWVAQFRAMGARLHIVAGLDAPHAPVPAPVPAAPAPLSLAPLAPSSRDMRDPYAAPAPAPIAANTPVPTEEITCPSCGERQPKRILCRSCACDMPRGIAAREEEATAERARRNEESMARRGVRRPDAHRSSSGSRFAAPRAEVSVAEDDAPLIGLSFDGRVGRLRYFFGGVVVMMFMCWPAVLLATRPNGLTLGLLFLVVVSAAVWGCRMTALRLHDIGHSGWWMLLLFVPLVGNVLNLALTFWPGTDGDNDYGAQPSPEGWARPIGALVVLFVSVGVLTKVAAPALHDRMQARAAQTSGESSEAPDVDVGEAPMPSDGQLQGMLRSEAAVGEFHRYMSASTHRAFAVSSAGAWGWHAGAQTPEQAMEMAVSDCNSRREAYSADCYLAHVDDQWATD